MTETNKKIIDMILKNATANEIVEETGLSSKQLFYRLNMFKIKGYNFSKKYFYDGQITYKLQKGFTEEKSVSLITSKDDKKVRIAFISDLHLSSEKERLDLLNNVYDVCAKEGINIIVNGGDLIDGLIGPHGKKFRTYEQQIEYAIKTHPFDKNILNFICLGNHDLKALEVTGQNLETALLNRRHDIVPLGYGAGLLNIKNDNIIIKHPNTASSREQIESVNMGFTVYGHYHHSKNVVNGRDINIYLAPLCDLLEKDSLPGFIIATISFNNGYFSSGVFEQYVFLDKMYKVNESHYQFVKEKNTKESIIKYEEDRIPYINDENRNEEKQKVKTLQTKKLSQSEKFKNRYEKKQ